MIVGIRCSGWSISETAFINNSVSIEWCRKTKKTLSECKICGWKRFIDETREIRAKWKDGCQEGLSSSYDHNRREQKSISDHIKHPNLRRISSNSRKSGDQLALLYAKNVDMIALFLWNLISCFCRSSTSPHPPPQRAMLWVDRRCFTAQRGCKEWFMWVTLDFLSDQTGLLWEVWWRSTCWTDGHVCTYFCLKHAAWRRTKSNHNFLYKTVLKFQQKF